MTRGFDSPGGLACNYGGNVKTKNVLTWCAWACGCKLRTYENGATERHTCPSCRERRLFANLPLPKQEK